MTDRILDTEDTSLLAGSSMLDHIKPERSSSRTRKVELVARKSHWPVHQRPSHCLDLDPAGGLTGAVFFIEVIARVANGRAFQRWLELDDLRDGLFFDLHARGLIEAVGVGSFFVRVCTQVRDEWATTSLTRRSFPLGGASGQPAT